MTAARLRLVFVLLVGAFGVVAAAAAVSLLALRDPFLAGVVALAGLFGVAAGAITYVAARQEPEEAGLEAEEPVADRPTAAVLPARRPIRVQALPVAQLPPAYLQAIMNGTRARTAALQQQPAQPQPRLH